MKHIAPPRLATRLLHWCLAPHRLEELEGDLDELFQQRVREVGLRQARWRYIRDVMSSLRPSLMKRKERVYPKPTNTTMIRNYLTVAFRTLTKNKGYSAINIGGLAIGMAVAMLIGLWVWDEVSYNQSFRNYGQIAMVRNRATEPLEQKTDSYNSLPQPMANVLRTKYSHLFKHVSLYPWPGRYAIKIGENDFSKTGQFFEKGAIDMFSLHMLQGNAASLDDNQSIIISASMAEDLFGDKNPINQSIKLNNKIDGKITGIYEDLPRNSFLGDVEFFGNFENLKANDEGIRANADNWESSPFGLLVQLRDNVTLEQANAVINPFYLKDAPSNFRELAKKYKAVLWLYPMEQWYLYSEFKDGYPVSGRITFVWLFAVIGLFVLLLACINFMNLSTARSEKRAKEVGIRKAIGSQKSQLVNQFLGESFLVVFLAFGIALGLISVSITAFNELADKQIKLPFSTIYFWFSSLVFLVVTALLSGLYPAFYLSSFRPVVVLKGTFRTGRYASLPRQILVVVQFTVSVVLIIGTVVVYQQIQHAQNRPVGYSRESLVRLSMDDPNFATKKEAFRNELLATGAVSDVAFSSMPITAIWDNWGGFHWKGKNPESESSFSVCWVNEDFGKTVQWKIKQGRDFSKAFSTDTAAVIINESAANYLGIKKPVGEFITYEETGKRRQIIGVVDDLVADSPYEPVKMGFYWLERNLNNLSQLQLKIDPDLPANVALAKVEAIQKKLVPSAPFTYSFVDKEYSRKFFAEQRVGRLALLFTVLAILISCLGLFGLASFVAEQRMKEIGIRKVLGASVTNLWQMLSKDFVLLAIISFLIATPIAWYFMSQWLQKYSYHIELSWWIFGAAGIGALLITLMTVSYQAVKAALVNPIKSLRSE